MFVFDSLPEELSLLERREVKRLVTASISNQSKAAQALRLAILSGELSAVETLAKARALDGAKDATQPKEYSLSWKGQTGALVEIKLEPHDAWGAVGTSYADGKVVEKRGELKKLPKPETHNGITYVGSIAKVGLTQERYDLVQAKINEMKADKAAQIERNIPGASELKATYENRANELDYYQSFMEKAHRNSFNKDRQPEVEKYEAEVKALEDRYPKAAKYLKWKGRDSSTSSGFNARKAAKHLEGGGTLEEAYAIAEEDLPIEPSGGASSEGMPGKDSNTGEQKPICQSELPISQRRYSLEELSDPATYQDDPALAKIARDIGVSRFNDLFANKMGRGDAKRAMTSGQYPQLVADEIEKIISKQEVEFTENQKGIIAALALSIDGYSIEPSATEIIIRGKFDEDLHSRIKRIGYWDGATYADRKVWVIPASKGGSLKTIFKNHLVAKDANEKARQAAASEAYAKAQESDKARRDARIEQQRKDAIAKSTRVKVEDGQYKVGDEINGKKISSFGSSWEEGGDTWVHVTDENSSAYGYQPGLDWYPKVKVSRPSVSYRYAYFEVD